MTKKKRKKSKEYGDKKKLERLHAQMRASQRYGIDFNRELRLFTVGNIKKGEGTLVFRQSNRVTIWSNVVPGYPEVVVAYDCKRHEVITFLKSEWFVKTPVEV